MFRNLPPNSTVSFIGIILYLFQKVNSNNNKNVPFTAHPIHTNHHIYNPQTNYPHQKQNKQNKMNNNNEPEQPPKYRPKRIILVRHGESSGNLDGAAYTTTPDHTIPLTHDGIQQAKLAGQQIRDVISDSGKVGNWKACFYVSPYERTRSTLREIGRSFPRNRVIGVKEECRIREQDFGNFQITERMEKIKETREKFGRFFYRFPEGESAADVFDRVSSFLESLWRDIDTRLQYDPSDDLNIIIVSHGLALRVFLMKWFKWTVEQFEYLNNLNNCEFRIMQLGDGGEYSLAVHHSEMQMQEWGLSELMIKDQNCRATGALIEKCPWYMDSFFDPLDADSEDGDDGDRSADKMNS